MNHLLEIVGVTGLLGLTAALGCALGFLAAFLVPLSGRRAQKRARTSRLLNERGLLVSGDRAVEISPIEVYRAAQEIRNRAYWANLEIRNRDYWATLEEACYRDKDAS